MVLNYLLSKPLVNSCQQTLIIEEVEKSFSGFRVLLTFLTCLLVGTLGYYLIEGWPLLDALYMTAITITTVGFHEEHPLSSGGKVFTIFLIFAGFGVCVITLSNLTALILRGELASWARRYLMNAKIKFFKNHFILCGYGRMGKVVARQLELKNIPFVVIESNRSKTPSLSELGHPVIVGSSSDESILKEAGVHYATCLISVVSNDAENAFTAMTARRLNRDLHIVSRCFRPSSVPKLKMSGVNKVISPFLLSGNRITQAAIHPTMVEFVEFIEDAEETSVEMADIIVEPNSKLVGETLAGGTFEEVGVIVVGIKKSSDKFVFHPKKDTIVEARDHLVIVGPREQVGKVAKLSH